MVKPMLRRPELALAAALATFLGACTPRPAEPPRVPMPEVNDENCRDEAVAALPPEIRTPFARLCFRRGSYTPSPPRQW
jgi:entry exclusion lipoprotein TrbK